MIGSRRRAALAESARLADRWKSAAGENADLRRQHDAVLAAILGDITAELTAAPGCPHNVRPSCPRCQYREALAKALRVAREAAGLE